MPYSSMRDTAIGDSEPIARLSHSTGDSPASASAAALQQIFICKDARKRSGSVQRGSNSGPSHPSAGGLHALDEISSVGSLPIPYSLLATPSSGLLKPPYHPLLVVCLPSSITGKGILAGYTLTILRCWKAYLQSLRRKSTCFVAGCNDSFKAKLLLQQIPNHSPDLLRKFQVFEQRLEQCRLRTSYQRWLHRHTELGSLLVDLTEEISLRHPVHVYSNTKMYPKLESWSMSSWIQAHGKQQ